MKKKKEDSEFTGHTQNRLRGRLAANPSLLTSDPGEQTRGLSSTISYIITNQVLNICSFRGAARFWGVGEINDRWSYSWS